MLWGWIPSWHPAGFSEEMFGKCWMSPALDRKPMAKARKEETEGNLRRWVSGKPRAGPGPGPEGTGTAESAPVRPAGAGGAVRVPASLPLTERTLWNNDPGLLLLLPLSSSDGQTVSR